jgi:hypothetical protein
MRDSNVHRFRAEWASAGSTCLLRPRPIEKNGKYVLEGAALAVSATDLLFKIIQLAVEHCHEFFGSGDDQTRAKHQIEKELNMGPQFPRLPKRYSPGSRVDWERLAQFVQTSQSGGA